MWDPNTCRICVKDSPQCKPLSTVDVQDNLSIYEKILLCVPEMKLGESEHLKICQTCIVLLVASYNFRNLCLTSENKIKKLSEISKNQLIQSLKSKESSDPTPNLQISNTVNIVKEDNLNEIQTNPATDTKTQSLELKLRNADLIKSESLQNVISKRYKLIVSNNELPPVVETSTSTVEQNDKSVNRPSPKNDPSSEKIEETCEQKELVPLTTNKQIKLPNLTKALLATGVINPTSSRITITDLLASSTRPSSLSKTVSEESQISSNQTNELKNSNSIDLTIVKSEDVEDPEEIKVEEFDNDFEIWREKESSPLLTLMDERESCVEEVEEECLQNAKEEDEESGRDSPLLEVLSEDIYDVPRDKEEQTRIELRRIIHFNPHLHQYRPEMFECAVALERLPKLEVSDGESSELLLCKCNHCGMTFNSTNKLLAHVKLHFLETPVRCDICKMVFTDSFMFNKHVDDHFDDKTVRGEQQMMASVPLKKTRPQYAVYTSKNATFQEITVVCIKNLYCQICDVKFDDSEASKEHWMKHCKSCLAFVKDIQVHSKIHLMSDALLISNIDFKQIQEYCTAKFHCQFCSANLTSFDTATKHMEQHCKICFKFVTGNISVHTACHKEAVNFNGEPAYFCLICKGFFTSLHFEMHTAKPLVNPAAELALNTKPKKIRTDSDSKTAKKFKDGFGGDEESDRSSRCSSVTSEEFVKVKKNTKTKSIKTEEDKVVQIIVHPPEKTTAQIVKTPSDINVIPENVCMDSIVEILSAVYYSSKEITQFDVKIRCLRELYCPICCITLTQFEAVEHFNSHCQICLILVRGSMDDHIKEHKQINTENAELYMCHACNKYIHLNHFISHFKKNFFECRSCDKFFLKKDHHIYHQILEHNCYECEYCGKLKNSEKGIKYHCGYFHQNLSNHNSVCLVCSKDLRYKNLLKFHMWDSHYDVRECETYFINLERKIQSELKGAIDIKNLFVGEAILSSKLKAFPQVAYQPKKNVYGSIKRKHDFPENKLAKMQKLIKEDTKFISYEAIIVESIKTFFCKACSIKFDTSESIAAHMKLHCSVCFLFTQDANHFKTHQAIKQGEIELFFCKQSSCNQYFKKDHFILHYHPRTARTHCPICTEHFDAKFNKFCMHMLTKHSLYACEYCLHVFNQLHSLAVHCSSEHAECEKLSKCYICKQHSNFNNTHMLHIFEEHMSCKKCNTYFDSIHEQLSHKAVCSPSTDNVTLEDPIVNAIINGTKLDQKLCHVKDSPFEIYSASCYTDLHCNICKTFFKNNLLVQEHLQTHCSICFEVCDNFNEHFELHKAVLTAEGQQMFYCLICLKYCDRNHFIFHHKESVTYTTCYVSNCKKVFDRKITLMLHAFNEHKTIICEFCQKYCYTPSGLHSHSLIHKANLVQITCAFCNKSFTCKSTYTFHLWKNHTYCKICNLSFETREHFKNHKCFATVQAKNPEQNVPKKNKIVTCVDCKKVFDNKENCILHAFNEHKLYICDVCGKKCSCLAGVNGHYINKHRSLISTYDCKICTKTFSYDYIYKFHIWREHTRCLTCDVSFKSIELLRLHECSAYSSSTVIESEEQLVDPSIIEQAACSLIDEDYASIAAISNGSSDSDTHNITYDEIKQSFVTNLFCKFCNVRLQNESAMKVHMEFHCPVCFKLCNDVDAHYKCHRTITKQNGQRLFFCFLCRVFHPIEHFLTHYKKQFLQCNACEKVCVTQDDYTLHLFSVHDLYFCESCGKHFTSMNNLITHCRHFHKELLNVNLQCEYCLGKMSFTNIEKLHVWKEHLTCKVCKITFPNIDANVEHNCSKAKAFDKKKLDVSTNITCDKCLGTIEDINNHNCLIDGTNTLYKCEICSRSFSRLAFNQHMKDHITHK